MKGTNTKFVERCKQIAVGKTVKRKKILFKELYNLKYPAESLDFESEHRMIWYKFQITATTLKDFPMKVWNGHNAIPEYTEHICPAGTKVLIWMVSRMGDIGITDNLTNPKGYDCRGVEEFELTNWEFLKLR